MLKVFINDPCPFFRLAERILGNRLGYYPFPWMAIWALTYKCNIQCDYCSIDNLRTTELSREDALKYFSMFINKGLRAILVTGGEPLLVSYVDEFLSFSRKMNLFTSLNTNGILVEHKLDTVKKAHRVNISLDGDETHNSFTRGGDFQKILRGLELLKSTKTQVILKAVVTAKNLSFMESITKIARDLSYPLAFQPVFSKKLDYAPYDSCLTEFDYEKYFDNLENLKRKYKGIIKNSSEEINLLRKNKSIEKCRAGLDFMRIEPDGSFKLCGRVEQTKKIDIYHLSQKDFLLMRKEVICPLCSSSAALGFNTLFSRLRMKGKKYEKKS